MKWIDKTGETNIHKKSGQLMTIISYKNMRDIDIQFEDGYIHKHTYYRLFKNGTVKNKNFNLNCKQNRIGEVSYNNQGLKMTIIDYIDSEHINIKFEDGSIIKNKQYSAFKTGGIKHPKVTHNQIIGKIVIDKYESKRLGETSIAKNGLKMTIIAYRHNRDIDIQFEDGIIVQHKRYEAFKCGEIKHPTIIAKEHLPKIEHIGDTIKANNGQMMTIIAYRDSEDVDVQFEDGTIVYNRHLSAFKKGQIKNPNLSYKKNYIGQTSINKDGLKMTIINYDNCKDIDVEFETGYIAKHKYYKKFLDGTIKHLFPYKINDIIIDNVAYVTNNSNFYCTCSKCNYKDIFTLEEAKNHICKE